MKNLIFMMDIDLKGEGRYEVVEDYLTNTR